MGTPSADHRVARVAARQLGHIRADQLASCGLGDGAVARRVEQGRLHRLHHGVYAVGHVLPTLEARIMAAVLAGGEGAAASHWTSAWLWRLARWYGGHIDVTVRGTGGRRRDGIRFHRSRSLAPGDVVGCRDIPVTKPARVLLEIAPGLSDHRLKRAVRQAQAEQLTTVGEIEDVLSRANGHRGTKRLARLVADGPTPTESGHEDDVLDLLLEAGIGRPDVNAPLVVNGNRYRPDLRWPAQRLILEVDSGWHDGRIAQELDAARQAELEGAGERVLRTTKDQATQQPTQLVRRLVAAGAPLTGRST